MSPVVGIVEHVSFTPGESVFVLDVHVGGEERQSHYLYAADGPVAFDGTAVSPAELLARLLAGPFGVRVTLHPDPQRYGASRQAEFVAK
jgi:hypothetical protein